MLELPTGWFDLNRDSEQATGLIAWWPALAHPGGSQFVDLSGYPAQDLSISGSLWEPNDGEPVGLKGDGSNDQATLSSNFGLSNSTPLTIWCRVHIPSTSLKGAMLKLGDSSTGFGIGIGNTTFDGLGNNAIGLLEGRTWVASGVACGTGVHTLALTFNPDGNSTRVYLDGRQVASSTFTAFSPTANLYMGGYTAGANARYFGGSVLDGRIYNRVLPADVLWQMHDPATRFDLYDVMDDDALMAFVEAVTPPGASVGDGLLWLLRRRRKRMR